MLRRAEAARTTVSSQRRPTLNEVYLAKAKAQVKDVRLFINGAAKRAAELARGAKPMVPTLPQDERTHLDIALLEIAEGKIRIVEEE
jgi:hypothetical protein